jgi:predicted ATPase/class 3 adenylate cyclase
MNDSTMGVRRSESRRYPSGTVVFLFTDVEGSTRRWESDPAKMSEALKLHDDTLRFAIESRGGYVFKTVGDGFCAAFDRIADAASAGEAIVKQLKSDAYAAFGTLEVRIAIHIGEAYEREGDYFGPTLNRIARLLQIGHPGQILLSAIAAESLRTNLPNDFELKHLDEHRLKDLAQPERVFQLVAPGLRADFPQLRSLTTIGENNLPLQPSALIGRDGVVAELRALLRTHRLVTLTGSGGIGKTRVSLQVAAELLDEFEDGVWFVDLAPTTDAALVASVIGTALRLEAAGESAPLEATIRYLESRRSLIVLDNCEHVITEAARSAEAILRRCAGVRLLATSREPLNIAGESVYRMPSLDVPPVKVTGGKNEALRYGSVMLFDERARAANSRFVMTDDVAPLVSEICRRLDGIALAIELAAARTDFFAPRELALALDRRFGVLTAGRRTALKRQQTLRAAVDWSFDLLSGTEKTLFRRLAIFSDGWTFQAAEAVCVDEALPASDLFEALSSLVQKSLVTANLQPDLVRFRFLESTRLYALEKLRSADEHDRMARAHLAWIVDLSERSVRSRGKIPLVQWLAQLEPEIENIREALRFAPTLEKTPLLAGRIVGALASFWFVAGLLHEGRRRIEAALEALGREGEPAIVADLCLGLAQLKPTESGRDEALHAIELFRRLGDRRGEARGEGTLAWVCWQIGNRTEAEAAVERALEIWRERGETQSYDYACDLDTYATILMSTGRQEQARSGFQETATLFAALGEDEGAAISRFNLAELEFAAGDARRALELTIESIVALRKQKSLGRLVIALTNTAGYRLALGDLTGARESAREVLSLGRRFQIDMIPYAIEHLAAIAARQGDVDRAARLLGFVEACYRSMHVERGATERGSFEIILHELGSKLTALQIATLQAEGERYSENAAVAEALLIAGGNGHPD